MSYYYTVQVYTSSVFLWSLSGFSSLMCSRKNKQRPRNFRLKLSFHIPCVCCCCCCCCLVAGVTQFAFYILGFCFVSWNLNVQQRRIRIWDNESVLINILLCAYFSLRFLAFIIVPQLFVYIFLLLFAHCTHTHTYIIIRSQMNVHEHVWTLSACALSISCHTRIK